MPAPASAPERRVSVLLVTYNSADEVAHCLDAALAQASGDLALELVVVDNASQDDTLERLRPYSERTTIVARTENSGYAEGVNEAFAASTAPWVLLLNPDAVMDPGCLEVLLSHLEREPAAGAAAALLRNPDGSPQHFARRDLDVRAVLLTMTEAGRRLDARRGGRALRYRSYADEWDGGIETPVAVDCPAAACVLIRRELLEPRPLDPAFPLFFNDGDLWRRLRRAGWRLDVVPEATAEHGYATSIRRIEAVRMRAEWVAAVRRYMAEEAGPLRRGAMNAGFLADALWSIARARLGRGDETTLVHVRGTLGGLGLPGGPPPWLTPVRRVIPARRRHRQPDSPPA